jgi:hypothetical protein
MEDLGAGWKEAKEDEKALRKYEKMADKDKERYLSEMKKFDPSWKPSKEKKADAEKKPPSGYQLFMKEEREKVKADNPEMNSKAIQSELGRLWSEEVKETKRGKKLNEQAKALKAEWDEAHPKEDKPKKSKSKKSSKKEKAEDDEGNENDDDKEVAGEQENGSEPGEEDAGEETDQDE